MRARFLARHPRSALYADFPDFAFFRVAMEELHLNGGFARAASLASDQIRTKIDGAAEVIACEADAIAHINADHPDVPRLLAAAFGAPPVKAIETGGWRAIGLDPEAIDLGNGERIVRVAFRQPVSTAAELRQALVDLAAAARRQDPQGKGSGDG